MEHAREKDLVPGSGTRVTVPALLPEQVAAVSGKKREAEGRRAELRRYKRFEFLCKRDLQDGSEELGAVPGVGPSRSREIMWWLGRAF